MHRTELSERAAKKGEKSKSVFVCGELERRRLLGLKSNKKGDQGGNEDEEG